jgi:hypothetical protein
MEVATDSEGDMIRILLVGETQAELRYIAMSELDAVELISALEWMDSFRGGMVGLPPAIKIKRVIKVKKPKTVVLELEKKQKPQG